MLDGILAGTSSGEEYQGSMHTYPPYRGGKSAQKRQQQ